MYLAVEPNIKEIKYNKYEKQVKFIEISMISDFDRSRKTYPIDSSITIPIGEMRSNISSVCSLIHLNGSWTCNLNRIFVTTY